MTTLDAEAPDLWHRFWAATVATFITLCVGAVVAVPVAVAWTAGFAVRLAVLIRSAAVEAYEVGRG